MILFNIIHSFAHSLTVPLVYTDESIKLFVFTPLNGFKYCNISTSIYQVFLPNTNNLHTAV